MNKSKIKKIIEKNNGIVTASEIAENSIDSWYLIDMVRNGKLERGTNSLSLMTSYR